MAETLDWAITAEPQAMEDLPSLVVGKSYSVSNDSAAIVFYRVAVAAPDGSARGHAIAPYRTEDFEYVAASSEKTFFWTRDPPATLVVTESA